MNLMTSLAIYGHERSFFLHQIINTKCITLIIAIFIKNANNPLSEIGNKASQKVSSKIGMKKVVTFKTV